MIGGMKKRQRRNMAESIKPEQVDAVKPVVKKKVAKKKVVKKKATRRRSTAKK